MKQTSRPFWREVLRLLPGVLISFIAVFLIIKMTNWKDIKSSVLLVNPLYLGAGVLLTLIWLVVRSFALRILLDRTPSLPQSFRAINIGYLLNNLFPLRAGEFGKAFVLGQSTKLGMVHVLSVIVIERALDLAFAAICLLSTLPLVFSQMAWAEPAARIILVLVVAGLVMLFLIARFQGKVQTWFSAIAGRWEFFHKFIFPQVTSLLNGLQVMTQPILFIASMFWIGISWGIGMLLYFIILRSFVPDAPFWWGIFINAVLAMGIAIPSAPSALGVFEAAIVGGLSLVGVDNSSSLVFAIIMHFLQFIITGVIGFISLAIEGLSMKKLFAEFRRNH